MKPPVAIVLLGVLAASVAAAQQPVAAPTPDAVDVRTVTAWLSSRAVPLRTLDPTDTRFDDLERLVPLLKGARIVALGEATHGTREFFQFKHRMLEFLVREMGFSVFAMEASYSAAMKVDAYVARGEGDRAAALSGLGFWTWDTTEVTDLIDWMRAYNRTAPEQKRVHFVGFDTQHVEPAITAVRSYVARLGPGSAKDFDPAFDALALSPAKIAATSEADKARVRANVSQLIGWLAFNQTPFARATSTQEFNSVLAQARTLLQYYETYSRASVNPYVVTPPPEDAAHAEDTGASFRDRLMADNVAAILDASPGARMVIWAHNTHISTERHTYSGWRNYRPMGFHLRRVFGDAFYSIGLLFDQGAFQARDMGRKDTTPSAPIEFTVPEAAAGSAEWYFAHGPAPNYFVDLRSAPTKGPVAEWLHATRIMRNIGGGFSPQWNAEYLIPTVLAEHFDGVVFVSRTTRARPNPGGLADPARGSAPRQVPHE